MKRREIAALLRQAGIENADGEARLLLERFGRVADRHADAAGGALLYADDPDAENPLLRAAVKRRLEREPLQYILGETAFYRETYRVTPDVLIPRPDTELLVEEAVRLLPQNCLFADLCTGSGCVAISVLAARPDLRAQAVDISEPALAVARENAVQNGVAERISFLRADLLGDDPPSLDGVCAILSNPPYICSSVLPDLDPELAFEPRLALDGGEDGVVFYRAILSRYAETVGVDGLFLFEIGYDQRQELTRLADSHRLTARFLSDYGGNDRVAVLTRSDSYEENAGSPALRGKQPRT